MTFPARQTREHGGSQDPVKTTRHDPALDPEGFPQHGHRDSKTGRIAQVIGSTFDAEFDEGHLPNIYNALTIDARGQGRRTST